MKRSELIEKMSGMKNEYITDKKIYSMYKQPFPCHFLPDYSAENDTRFNKTFEYETPKNKRNQFYYNSLAFVIASVMAESFKNINKKVILEMMQITGYTADEMDKFVRNEKYFMPDSVRPSSCVLPAAILTRALRDTFYDQAEWVGFSKGKLFGERPENNSLKKLKRLVAHMRDKKIINLDTISEQEYENAITESTRYLCRYFLYIDENSQWNSFQAKLIKSLENNYKMTAMQIKNEKDSKKNYNLLASTALKMNADLQAEKKEREEYYTLLKKAKNYETNLKKEGERIFHSYEVSSIVPSMLLAILNGDEVYKTLAGEMFADVFVSFSKLPVKTLWTPTLDDNKAWTENCNQPVPKNLTESILTKEDQITVGDGLRVQAFLKVPVSTVISRFACHSFGEELHLRKSVLEFFKSNGFSDERARDFAIIVATLDQEKRFTKNSWKDSIYFPCESSSVVEENENLLAAMEKKESENEALKKELAAAKKKLREIDYENEKLKDEIKQLKENAIQESIEITEDSTEEEDVDIVEITSVSEYQFPYHTNTKVVVYGGFENFHKRLQEFLPDIRIIDVAAHIDVNPVRNADVVFLQTNKTNHSGYYLVCDACKNSQVPYIYLNYSSAEKCAEVIVNELEKRKCS